MRQSRPPELLGNRNDERRGEENESMSYFLTDHFREILETSQNQYTDPAANQDEDDPYNKKKDDGPVGIYKSIFLRKKVEEQLEKRGQNRGKGKVPGKTAGKPRGGAAGAAGDNKKKGGARGGPKIESEDQLMNVIDDLHKDLQLRDQEFQDQRAYLEIIQAQNDELKKELRKTQLEKIEKLA